MTDREYFEQFWHIDACFNAGDISEEEESEMLEKLYEEYWADELRR